MNIQLNRFKVTFAFDCTFRSNVGESCLASALDWISRRTVRALSVRITTTVADLAAIYYEKMNPWTLGLTVSNWPSHFTEPSIPMLVNPVLQAHLTALLVESCEHCAFGSQPPLFTLQLSIMRWWTYEHSVEPFRTNLRIWLNHPFRCWWILSCKRTWMN